MEVKNQANAWQRETFTAHGMTLIPRRKGIWDKEGFTLFAHQCLHGGVSGWIENVECRHNLSGLVVNLKDPDKTPRVVKDWIYETACNTLMCASVGGSAYAGYPLAVPGSHDEPVDEDSGRFMLLSPVTGLMHGIHRSKVNALWLLNELRAKEPESLWMLVDIVNAAKCDDAKDEAPSAKA